MDKENFSKDLLKIDPAIETHRISQCIKKQLAKKLRRRGFVVAVSGGIDSSVTLALAAKAVGPDRVIALLMPERQSGADTLRLSISVAESVNVKWIHEDISNILQAVGFYNKYDDAIREVIPEYGDGWKSKIVISNVLQRKHYSVFYVVALSPQGKEYKERMPLSAYLKVVAATNFKQRIRKMLEYYHADFNNYAVTGTPNRLEYDQGFFVKLGDGAGDVKPIAHLYKSQVYQLSSYLGIPEEVISRPPTTDTYSLSQGQDEFFFSLPYNLMDLCLYGKNNGFSIEEISQETDLSVEQIRRIFKDIDTKRTTTKYLHMQPLLVDNIGEVE